MTAPTYIGHGGYSVGNLPISVAVPSGYMAGDLLLLVVNGDGAITTPSGWTLEISHASAAGTIFNFAVFYKIAGGSESSVTVADAGDFTSGIMLCFRGVDTSSGFDSISTGGATSSTNASLSSVTTTTEDNMIVLCVGTQGDRTFSGWGNANLTSLTEVAEYNTTIGGDSSLAVAVGIKGSIGATGTTSCTVSSSAYAVRTTVALPPVRPLGNSLFFGSDL